MRVQGGGTPKGHPIGLPGSNERCIFGSECAIIRPGISVVRLADQKNPTRVTTMRIEEALQAVPI